MMKTAMLLLLALATIALALKTPSPRQVQETIDYIQNNIYIARFAGDEMPVWTYAPHVLQHGVIQYKASRSAALAASLAAEIDKLFTFTSKAKGKQCDIRAKLLDSWCTEGYTCAGKNYCWKVHWGVMGKEIADFARIILLEDRAALYTAHGAQAEQWVATLQRGADQFTTETISGNKYRAAPAVSSIPTNCGSTDFAELGSKALPYNQACAPAHVNLLLHVIYANRTELAPQGGVDHLSKARSNLAFYRDSLWRVTSGRAPTPRMEMDYWIGGRPEDAGHMRICVDFAVAARQLGVTDIISTSHLRDLARTFLSMTRDTMPVVRSHVVPSYAPNNNATTSGVRLMQTVGVLQPYHAEVLPVARYLASAVSYRVGDALLNFVQPDDRLYAQRADDRMSAFRAHNVMDGGAAYAVLYRASGSGSTSIDGRSAASIIQMRFDLSDTDRPQSVRLRIRAGPSAEALPGLDEAVDVSAFPDGIALDVWTAVGIEYADTRVREGRNVLLSSLQRAATFGTELLAVPVGQFGDFDVTVQTNGSASFVLALSRSGGGAARLNIAVQYARVEPTCGDIGDVCGVDGQCVTPYVCVEASAGTSSPTTSTSSSTTSATSTTSTSSSTSSSTLSSTSSSTSSTSSTLSTSTSTTLLPSSPSSASSSTLSTSNTSTQLPSSASSTSSSTLRTSTELLTSTSSTTTSSSKSSSKSSTSSPVSTSTERPSILIPIGIKKPATSAAFSLDDSADQPMLLMLGLVAAGVCVYFCALLAVCLSMRHRRKKREQQHRGGGAGRLAIGGSRQLGGSRQFSRSPSRAASSSKLRRSQNRRSVALVPIPAPAEMSMYAAAPRRFAPAAMQGY